MTSVDTTRHFHAGNGPRGMGGMNAPYYPAAQYPNNSNSSSSTSSNMTNGGQNLPQIPPNYDTGGIPYSIWFVITYGDGADPYDDWFKKNLPASDPKPQQHQWLVSQWKTYRAHQKHIETSGL